MEYQGVGYWNIRGSDIEISGGRIFKYQGVGCSALFGPFSGPVGLFCGCFGELPKVGDVFEQYDADRGVKLTFRITGVSDTGDVKMTVGAGLA